MGWPERLDAMERRLQAARATIAYGAPADRGPLPEADGPLPPELEGRARAVLAATEAVQRQVLVATEEVADRLARIGTGPAPGTRWEPERQPPAYVDARA